MSKILEPIWNKIFIERTTVPVESSRLWTPTRIPDDEGKVVHSGNSKDVKVGDYVKFALRGSSEIQFENKLVISVDSDQILAIITK